MNSILKSVFRRSLFVRFYSSEASVPVNLTLPYLKESEELSYKTVQGGHDFYIINFKKGPDGAKFFKLSQRSKGRRCNIFFGLGEDTSNLLNALKQAPHVKPEEVISVWTSSALQNIANNIQRLNDHQIVIIQEMLDTSGKFKKIFIDRKLCDHISNLITEEKNKIEK